MSEGRVGRVDMGMLDHAPHPASDSLTSRAARAMPRGDQTALLG